MNTKSVVFAVLCFTVFGLCSEISAQERIRFARGRTSATVSGTLGVNESGRVAVAASPTWAHPVVTGKGILIKDRTTIALLSLD